MSCRQVRPEASKNGTVNSTVSSLKPVDKLYRGNDTLTLNDLDSALDVPDKVFHLIIEPRFNPSSRIPKYSDLKHLPSELGSLVNLKILEIRCLEKLEDLPFELGQLEHLEKLIIDNGNGCVMNISIPSSIGKLHNLKELTLHGAINATYFQREDSLNKTINPLSKVNHLPLEISDLLALEILDLGRNHFDYFPPQIEHLINLKALRLEYSRIKEIPSFISKLKSLQELNLGKNGHVKFPDSLKEMQNITIKLSDNGLTINEQRELKERFPNITFDFQNDYGGNEEPTL